MFALPVYAWLVKKNYYRKSIDQFVYAARLTRVITGLGKQRDTVFSKTRGSIQMLGGISQLPSNFVHI